LGDNYLREEGGKLENGAHNAATVFPMTVGKVFVGKTKIENRKIENCVLTVVI